MDHQPQNSGNIEGKNLLRIFKLLKSTEKKLYWKYDFVFRLFADNE